MIPRTGLMTTIVLATLFTAILLSGCASPAPERKTDITVFAAASLKEAFAEIKSNYEADHPGANVVLNIDGSQQLRTQIEQGASADVFASAGTSHMSALMSEGLVNNSSVVNFAGNSLAIIVPQDNPARVGNMSDLARPGVKIAIGVKEVPVGFYTLQALDKTANSTAYGPEYRTKVRENVVSEEITVSYIVSRVALGEADAGFVYASDVPAGYKDELKIIPVPEDLNVVAIYPIGVLRQTGSPGPAQEFVDYVRSAEGKVILNKYGFISP